MTYYGIYIPSKLDLGANDEPFVFTKKEEALKVLKNHKDARLKIFKNNEEAINYAQTGSEIITPKFSELKSPVNIEKLKFHAPTKQELIQFRKAIEEDRYETVKGLIWENPRYLVNLADTPTSLKDGPRYNALHVCAIHKRSQIAALILETISDIEFVGLLHSQSDSRLNQEASDVLLDYYLNMPEKGRSETPLHLASKYGAVDVVEVLTAYPQCKMTPNLENLLPRDIICSRMDNPTTELKGKILSLLEERFYVPVIRSVDNSIPPIIGEPFSQANPPELNKDPMSPELKIQAYAGPIRSKEEAQKFRRRWKTPPRNGTAPLLTNSPYISPMKIRCSTPTKLFNNNNNSTLPISDINYISAKKNLSLNFEDTENANNVICHNTISESGGKFSTLTPLIKNPKKKDLFFTYRDKAASPLVLDDSDSYSSSGNWEISDKDDTLSFNSPGLKERHLKLTDTEKGFEIIGRELAKEKNIGWKEYWDFLGTFVDIASTEGLTKLEAYIAKKSKKNKLKRKFVKYENTKFLKDRSTTITSPVKMTAIDLSPSSSSSNLDITTAATAANTSQATTPFLCVEKSLQVFAKRMTKTIMNNLDSVVSINDAFLSELKRLKSLVCSFRDDVRFLNIDFNVIHSRFANLIATFLYCEIDPSSLEKIKKCFQQIIQSRKKSLMDRGNTDKKEQLQCISEMILDYLECTGNKDKIQQPENIKTEQMCSEIWQEELKCNCNWKSDLSRQETIRKRRLARHLDKAQLQSQELDDRKAFEDFNSVDEISRTEGEEYEKELDEEDNDVEEEEDIFWSDVGSNESDDDDEKFYTPPESPTQLDVENYEYFLMKNEPTKRDWDVVKALHNVNIDKAIYPNIYRWKAAVLRYSFEECEGFPSPSVVKNQIKRDIDSNCWLDTLSKMKQCLFDSPIQQPIPKYSQISSLQDDQMFASIESFHDHNTLSSSSEKNSCQVKSDFSANLSLLNISDI